MNSEKFKIGLVLKTFILLTYKKFLLELDDIIIHLRMFINLHYRKKELAYHDTIEIFNVDYITFRVENDGVDLREIYLNIMII